MKILFLDIDGVLLPGRAYMLPYQTKPIVKEFDPCAVSMINTVLSDDAVDAKIAIHSSWLRHWTEADGESVRHHMIEQGIEGRHFHDDPECLGSMHWRYDRIDEWLYRHKEIEDFVVLDDEPCSPDWPRKDHLILTDFDEGITMNNYRELFRRLRKDTDVG